MDIEPRSVLEFLIPTLPEVFLAREQARELSSVVRDWPAAPAGWLECRLGAEAHLPDCGLMLEPSMATWLTRQAAPPALHAPLLHLDEILATGLNGQAELLAMLGLEFDQPLQKAGSAEPLPFFALQPAAALERQLHFTLVETILSLLGQQRLIPVVHRVLERLPAGTSLDQFGVLSARDTPVVRLNLGGLQPEVIADVLGSCGWPGALCSLDSDLQVLSQHCSALEIGLDLHLQGVSPRLGVECFGGQEATSSTDDDLATHLVRQGLCTPAKAEALLTWPAALQAADHPGSWPKDHCWSERLLAGSAVRIIRRWLNHIKLIHLDGSWSEAKAYLFFGPEWLSLSEGIGHRLAPSPENTAQAGGHSGRVRP